jgi:hypothetical protein
MSTTQLFWLMLGVLLLLFAALLVHGLRGGEHVRHHALIEIAACELYDG